MRKYLKHTIYIFIALVGLLFLCFIKTFIFSPFLQRYIYAQTGRNYTFDNFYILPFSLTLENVKLDDLVTMQSVRFKLNPVKFLAHIICPVVFINHIDISKLKVSLSKNFFHCFKDNIIRLPKSEVSVFIDEIITKNNIDFFKISNANIIVKPNCISVDFIVYVLGTPIKFKLYGKRIVGGVLDTSSIFTLKNKINIIVSLNGKINLSSLNVNQNIVIEKFELGSISKDKTKVISEIDVPKVNKDIHRNNLSFKYLNVKKKINFNLLSSLNFILDNFSLLEKKNNDKVYNVKYTYASEKEIKVTYCKNGNYKLRLIVKNKVAGMIRGNIKTGELVVDVRNINVEDVPIIPFVIKDIKGIINILGSINRTSGRINLKFEKFSLLNLNIGNIEGSITRNNNLYLFNFLKSNGSVVLKTVIEGNKVVSTNFNFNDINISEIFHIYKCPVNKIAGKISGYINYKKNALTKFDIKAFEVTLYDNRFKKIEVNGDMNFSRINIKNFVLKDNSGKLSMDVAGMILLKKELNISSIYVNMKNVYICGLKTTGCLKFQNNSSNDDKIKGVIRGNDVKISGVSFENIVANAAISSYKLEIADLRSDNGVKGAFFWDFKENKFLGNLYFKDTNIEGVYPGVYGLLNSIVKFSGKLNNPDINTITFLTKGKYLSNFFSLSSESTYKNGVVTFDAILSADKTKITIKKDCLKNDTFSLTVDNLTGKIISMFSNFKIPLNGLFSGNGIFTIIDGRHQLKMFLKAKNAYIEAFRFNDVRFDIEVTRSNVRVNNAFARVLDSEIKIDKGFFDTENGRYGFNLSLLNMHIGPIDLFGNLKLFGKIIKREKGSIYYNGTVDFNDLWINNYHLHCFHFNYTAKDKILEFFNKVDSFNPYECSGLIILDGVVPIRKFNILKDKTSFNLDVDSLGDYINLKAKGANIDWSFITNILNLPIFIEGDADINISLLGNINNPKGDMTIASANGSIMEIPYDNFDVEINFWDNIVTLKKVAIVKLKEISVYIRGSLPFWFNKTLFNKTKKKYIDVFYDIEDNKLGILKYLSKGFIKHNSGKMFLKGSVTGTCEKVNNNANLLIIGGSFELKDYIDKIKNISVEMSINENLVRINKFNFKSGHGKLNIYGQIGISNFSVKDFDIRFITNNKGIPLHIPQLPIPSSTINSKYLLKDYSFGEPCFDIKIQGTAEKAKIFGFILLKNTRFTFPGNINCENKIPIFSKDTEFDLELKTSENTKFENSFVSALIRGSLFIKGFYNDIKVKGTVESSNGIVDYLGYGFDILNAKIEIIDDDQIYVTAECKTTRYSGIGNESENIKLVVPRCNISNLRFYLNYDNQKKILGRIIETEQDTKLNLLKFEPSLDFEIRRQVLHLIDQNITTPFARAFLRKIRLVDDFKVSYAQTDNSISVMDNITFTKLLCGTRYSIEKNLTDKFLIGYSVTFDKFNKRLDLYHSIEIRYRIANSLFLNASYGSDVNVQSHYQRHDEKLMLQYQVRF
ncbi:MAG: AsmA family protein [Endomicrobium sp.]|jgi:hypothetical protein|nr:AsmA family protein [Endomicrobium sp.]